MTRSTFGLVILAGTAFAAAPHQAAAQLSVQVGLYWELGDDGWRAYRPAYESRPYDEHARPREVVYYTPRRAVRVPPGHMPRPGYCRLWYPGRPPGHQPRARPCEQVFRMRHYGGAVILGAPDFRPDFRGARWDGDDDRDDYDRDDDDRGWRGRGRGRGGR